MEARRDDDVEYLLQVVDGVTDQEKHYKLRSTVLRLDSENRRLNEQCVIYEEDLKRKNALLAESRNVLSNSSALYYEDEKKEIALAKKIGEELGIDQVEGEG